MVDFNLWSKCWVRPSTTAPLCAVTHMCYNSHVMIDCSLLESPVTCYQSASQDGGDIAKTSAEIPAASVVFQAVDVTATHKENTGDKHTTKHHHDNKQQAQKTTSGSASATTGGAAVVEATRAPWGVFGAVGAGLMAFAAL